VLLLALLLVLHVLLLLVMVHMPVTAAWHQPMLVLLVV
jgi:hypothetical protein